MLKFCRFLGLGVRSLREQYVQCTENNHNQNSQQHNHLRTKPYIFIFFLNFLNIIRLKIKACSFIIIAYFHMPQFIKFSQPHQRQVRIIQLYSIDKETEPQKKRKKKELADGQIVRVKFRSLDLKFKAVFTTAWCIYVDIYGNHYKKYQIHFELQGRT